MRTTLLLSATLLLSTGLSGSTARAKEKRADDRRFIRRAMAFSDEALNRSWGNKSHEKTAPQGHEGHWVEAKNAIVTRFNSTDDVAFVSWRGTTSENIEYYLVMRVTVDGPPPPKEEDDNFGSASTETADTWWTESPRPKREKTPEDSRILMRAVTLAERELPNEYKIHTRDIKGAPKHEGKWLDPSKAIIERFPGNKALATVRWEGTTKEGIRYTVFENCDLRNVPDLAPGDKDVDGGGDCMGKIMDPMWGPVPKRR